MQQYFYVKEKCPFCQFLQDEKITIINELPRINVLLLKAIQFKSCSIRFEGTPKLS